MNRLFVKISLMFGNYWCKQYERIFQKYKWLEHDYEILKDKYERLKGTVQKFEDRRER